MSLIHDNTLNCTECNDHHFVAQEQVVFHQAVRERFYDQDKEQPLPHMQKIIIYKCASCGHPLDK